MGEWLANTLPGAERPIILKAARIFFPEERTNRFNRDCEWLILNRSGFARE
jgi:hypothetical protein